MSAIFKEVICQKWRFGTCYPYLALPNGVCLFFCIPILFVGCLLQNILLNVKEYAIIHLPHKNQIFFHTIEVAFYFGKNATSLLSLLVCKGFCVVAIEVMHFSVCVTSVAHTFLFFTGYCLWNVKTNFVFIRKITTVF